MSLNKTRKRELIRAKHRLDLANRRKHTKNLLAYYIVDQLDEVIQLIVCDGMVW